MKSNSTPMDRQNVTSENQMSLAEAMTPRDLIKKHISDPNHIITDEEFSKLMVGIFSGATAQNETTLAGNFPIQSENVYDNYHVVR